MSKMPAMTREDALVCAVMAVVDQRQQWAEAESTELPEAFLSGVDDCINAFSTGDIPGECRPLEKLVERMAREWREFELSVSRKNPLPKREFWLIIDEMANSLTFAPPDSSAVDTPIETIQQLLDEKCTWRQIAIIYSHDGVGPFMLKGVPQPHLVKQEHEKPGTILGANWEHPRVTAAKALAAKYENRIARRAEQLRRENATLESTRENSMPAQAGSETIADLIAQGLNDNQIAKIKLITPQQAAAERKAIESGAAEISDEAAIQIEEWLDESPELSNQQIAEAVGCEPRQVALARSNRKHPAA
jgi:hypothetical protein